MARHANMTAMRAAEKWQKGMQGAGDEIKAGVNAVTQAPGPKAAAQKAYWLQRLTASADKWAKRVAAVSLNQWQQSMINKGIPNIQQGLDNGAIKFESWMGTYLPAIKSAMGSAPARQKGNIGAAVARVQAALTATQKIANQYNGRQ